MKMMKLWDEFQIHRTISTNEIYAQYERASHHAIFLLQKFINEAPIMEPKLLVKLMVLCCFPLMWNIKSEAYRASGFQVTDADSLEKILSCVHADCPATTLEHVIGAVSEEISIYNNVTTMLQIADLAAVEWCV